MMLIAILLLLFIKDGLYSQENCSYQDVLNYLNLTKNNELFSMTRPVKHYERPTRVNLEVLLFAILDVVEKEQKFVPYVLTFMMWKNEYISWDPSDFCGIDRVFLPTEILWKPDLFIEEMTEKDKAPPNPYLAVNSNGEVGLFDHMVLVSTCRMRVYNFPFDTQSCNLSVMSFMHSSKEIELRAFDNSSEATEWSREVMHTQYEWSFIDMNVTTKNASNSFSPDVIVYTINMKRRSALYILNFILPIMFLLCLDIASFMISDHSGEKLSFQVTVLLAITVLQLILNEILPSSSDSIPLIAIYCIGVFALMMLNLLESILMMYLMEKDSAPQGKETDNDHSGDLNNQGKGNLLNFNSNHRGGHNWNESRCIYDGADETPCELLSVNNENNSNTSQTVEESRFLEKLSKELREMEKALILQSKKEEHKPGYWSRLAKRINRVFFIFYVSTVCGFLIFVSLKWSDAL